jgi:hypothetical protein
MLEALMKFGGYRIDRFCKAECTGREFGFYIRPQTQVTDHYFIEAKHQLYYGLALIQAQGELHNLAGIYIDINDLENLQRPAYLAMKQDLRAGRFAKVLISDRETLFGCSCAEADLFELANEISGFELFHFQEGEPVALPLYEKVVLEAVRN